MLNATLNEEIRVYLVGEDKDGDDVSFYMDGSPAGAVLEIFNETSVYFKWTPRFTDNVSVSILPKNLLT